jgi:hypothetical protein
LGKVDPWFTGAQRASVEKVRRTPLDSSAIQSVGYDPDTAVLEVEFTSGELYRYFAVPRSVHRDLVEAQSPGHYFSEHIREVYPTEHVLR